LRHFVFNLEIAPLDVGEGVKHLHGDSFLR
jgi:hypothetical protein